MQQFMPKSIFRCAACGKLITDHFKITVINENGTAGPFCRRCAETNLILPDRPADQKPAAEV